MLSEVSSEIYKHTLIMRRELGELSWLFVHPFIGFLSLGIFAFFLMQSGAPIESMYFVVVGVIAWNFFGLVERGLTYGYMMELWSGCHKHIFLGKMSMKQFMLGDSIFGLLSGLFVTVLIGVASAIIFQFNIFSVGIFLLLGLIPIALHAIVEGALIVSLLMSKGTQYRALIWVLPGIAVIFSGVYYPISVLPEPVRTIALFLPTTHGIAGIRSAVELSFGEALRSISIGTLLGIIYLVITWFIVRWAIGAGKRNGEISKDFG